MRWYNAAMLTFFHDPTKLLIVFLLVVLIVLDVQRWSQRVTPPERRKSYLRDDRPNPKAAIIAIRTPPAERVM